MDLCYTTIAKVSSNDQPVNGLKQLLKKLIRVYHIMVIKHGKYK
jgi:hypothetical protein